MENNKDIICCRCGACCHVDMMAYISPEDIHRWENEDRRDIIDRMRNDDVIWLGDRIINRFGEKVSSCVFLNRKGTSFFCDIYETRPLVCRNYLPGSSELCPQYYREE